MTPQTLCCLGWWCQLSTSDKCPSCNETFPSWHLTQKKMKQIPFELKSCTFKKSLMTLNLRLHFSHNWFVIDWYGQGAISRRLSVLMWWGNLSAAPAPELLKYFYRSQSRSRGKSSVYPETYFDRNITTPTDQQTHSNTSGDRAKKTSGSSDRKHQHDGQFWQTSRKAENKSFFYVLRCKLTS